MTPTPVHHLGSRNCSITGTLLFVPSDSRDSPLGPHPTADPLPIAERLNRKPLWCCFLCICPPSPRYCPRFPRALGQLLTVPSSSCLLKAFYVTLLIPHVVSCSVELTRLCRLGQVGMTRTELLPGRSLFPPTFGFCSFGVSSMIPSTVVCDHCAL